MEAYGRACSEVMRIHARAGRRGRPPSAGPQTSQVLGRAAAHTGPLGSQSAALHLETADTPSPQDTCKTGATMHRYPIPVPEHG